jgi:hypothetical protein
MLQVLPPLPQAEALVPPWQLPLASTHPLQLAELQTPFTHACPVAQTEQTPPLAPHCVGMLDGVRQMLFGAQHPLQLDGPQLVVSWHVPCDEQAKPEAQAMHALPFVPQAPLAAAPTPGWQMPTALQQPAQFEAEQPASGVFVGGTHPTAKDSAAARASVVTERAMIP